jgi:hypothetical protein
MCHSAGSRDRLLMGFAPSPAKPRWILASRTGDPRRSRCVGVPFRFCYQPSRRGALDGPLARARTSRQRPIAEYPTDDLLGSGADRVHRAAASSRWCTTDAQRLPKTRIIGTTLSTPPGVNPIEPTVRDEEAASSPRDPAAVRSEHRRANSGDESCARRRPENEAGEVASRTRWVSDPWPACQSWRMRPWRDAQ